jgi:hypothetical protein
MAHPGAHSAYAGTGRRLAWCAARSTVPAAQVGQSRISCHLLGHGVLERRRLCRVLFTRWPLLLEHLKSQQEFATKSIAGRAYSTRDGGLFHCIFQLDQHTSVDQIFFAIVGLGLEQTVNVQRGNGHTFDLKLAHMRLQGLKRLAVGNRCKSWSGCATGVLGGVEPARHCHHARIIHRVALFVRQSADAMRDEHHGRKHGVQHTTTRPGFLRSDGHIICTRP